jgi:hypothetical protein
MQPRTRPSRIIVDSAEVPRTRTVPVEVPVRNKPPPVRIAPIEAPRTRTVQAESPIRTRPSRIMVDTNEVPKRVLPEIPKSPEIQKEVPRTRALPEVPKSPEIQIPRTRVVATEAPIRTRVTNTQAPNKALPEIPKSPEVIPKVSRIAPLTKSPSPSIVLPNNLTNLTQKSPPTKVLKSHVCHCANTVTEFLSPPR